MIKNVCFGIEVETGNVANGFKRKDILGKYSELHLMAIRPYGR